MIMLMTSLQLAVYLQTLLAVQDEGHVSDG